jgi:hypothetical protein
MVIYRLARLEWVFKILLIWVVDNGVPVQIDRRRALGWPAVLKEGLIFHIASE